MFVDKSCVDGAVSVGFDDVAAGGVGVLPLRVGAGIYNSNKKKSNVYVSEKL